MCSVGGQVLPLFISSQQIFLSLVPRLLHQKTGREPGRFHHVPRYVACMVLIIELLPMQSESKIKLIVINSIAEDLYRRPMRN